MVMETVSLFGDTLEHKVKKLGLDVPTLRINCVDFVFSKQFEEEIENVDTIDDFVKLLSKENKQVVERALRKWSKIAASNNNEVLKASENTPEKQSQCSVPQPTPIESDFTASQFFCEDCPTLSKQTILYSSEKAPNVYMFSSQVQMTPYVYSQVPEQVLHQDGSESSIGRSGTAELVEVKQSNCMSHMPMSGLRPLPMEERNDLKCVHCSYLLKNPVQTEDGVRLCKDCYVGIQRMNGPCSECGVVVDENSNAFPDRAAAQELDRLPVYCINKCLGCDWVGPLKDWENHCEQCNTFAVRNSHISMQNTHQDVSVPSSEQHLLMKKPVNCAMLTSCILGYKAQLRFEVLPSQVVTTYNGYLLWRIPGIAKRHQDALEGRILSIYSPIFYTGRHGYKMCCKLYLNGDGMGLGTHISLFFVLMRGDYDASLEWPFEHKVSLILVDQTHRKHIVQTFKPTTDSLFIQPTSDTNIASGSFKFASIDVLHNVRYVNKDTMFIECIVDTSKIVLR